MTFVPGGFVRLVDFSDGVRRRASEPVAAPEVIAMSALDKEVGTVTWPKAADWSPTVLFLRSRRALPR